MRKRNLLISIAIIAILMIGVVAISSWTNRPAPAPVIDGQEGYDVIVVGGDPEGVAAALSAARNGLRTLLIEDDGALGGLMTLGQLNFLDMNHGPQGELLTRGIFEEFYKDLGNAFDIEKAKEWFLTKTGEEKNLTTLLNAKVTAPIMEGKVIKGVRVVTIEEKDGNSGDGANVANGTEKEYLGLQLIDATVDADLAVAAGVPYTVGGEDYGEEGLLMGVTLVFEVAGVDWNEVVQYLKHEDDDPHTGADQVSAWGYGKEAADYKPLDTQMRFRGPNIARQKNGNVLINALLIFGVDSLDPESKAAGIERGRQEIPHIIEFMRERFRGFAKAEFVSTADQLYVRETRHIEGEYRLTITDVLEQRDQWDRVGHGSYPVDVQPTSPGNFGNVIGYPDIYSVPFRSLVPLEVENLLVVGRSASYDSLPHGSARVIPIGMVTGEAAGVASKYAISNELSFREISRSEEAISWIQNRLKSQGAYLVEYDPPRPAVMDHWAYPAVRDMRELGLIEGGYTNDYRLERPASQASMQNKINKVLRVAKERNPKITVYQVEIPTELTRQFLLQVTAESLTGKKNSPEEVQRQLREKGILTAELGERMTDLQAVPDFAEMLSILANLYNYLLTL